MAKYQKYAEYKDSEISWLGKIPSHWDMSKLRYLFDFSKGLSITKENLQDEGIPCVNYGEVHSKYGFEVNPKKHQLKCVSENYLKSSENALLNKGDFVFADTSEDLKGSGSFTHLVGNEQIFAGYHTVIARPYDASRSRFYAYLFDSKEFRSQIQLVVKGVKVFSITQAILRAADAWLPSTDEQIKIANFLDHETAKIDTLIAKQEKLIELLKEKRQAVISHAVTKGLNPNVVMKDSGVEWLGLVPEHWKCIKLKHITTLFEQGWSPQCDSRPAELNEYGVLKVGCVNNSIFRASENKALPPELEPRLQYLIKKNDLLISRANTKELVGSAAVVDDEYPNLILCDKLYRLRLAKNVIPEMVSLYLSISVVREQIELSATGASHSMQNIGQDTINELWYLLPSFEEAECILKKININNQIFNSLIEKAELAIQLMQERRTALISAAVTGKIDVRNWHSQNKNNNQDNKELSA